MDFLGAAYAVSPGDRQRRASRGRFVAEPSFPSRFSRDTRLPTDHPPSDPGPESTDRLLTDELTTDFPGNAYAGIPLTVTGGGAPRTANCSFPTRSSRDTPLPTGALRPTPDSNPPPDPGPIPGPTT